MLFYDIETLRGPDEVEGGWTNPYGMGFGTAVVFNDKNNLYSFYGPNDAGLLLNNLNSEIVVSFNGIKFDNRVLLGNENKEEYWVDIDLLLEVVKSKFKVQSVLEAEEKYGNQLIHDGSIGLNGLSQGTLGLSKTGHGAHAPELIKQRKWAEVFSYNLNDVRLTKMLYKYAKKYNRLIDGKGNIIKLNLDV